MAGYRVLLVEDDRDDSFFITRSLEALGCSVTAERRGPDALDRLRRGETFDLVLVDYIMEEMRGNELAERARRLVPSLRVAFVTGFDDLLAVSGRAGAAPVIPKPPNPLDLTSELGRLLGLSAGPDLAAGGAG